jgi:hypothetical protein
VSIPHQMTRTRTLERSVEIWSCTQCSRQVLFHWLPAFKTVVLDRGDEGVGHVGGSVGGMRLAVEAADPIELPADERGWLASHGIEWEALDTPEA